MKYHGKGHDSRVLVDAVESLYLVQGLESANRLDILQPEERFRGFPI